MMLGMIDELDGGAEVAVFFNLEVHKAKLTAHARRGHAGGVSTAPWTFAIEK